MTFADQAAMTGQDGQVADKRPSRPVRRTLTAAYKARILAAYDAMPEGSAEREGLLGRNVAARSMPPRRLAPKGSEDTG
ncbi:hypothetical protein FHR32_003718 [Streptosporangium album]|uniref:Transposase n=1 Tax=Streptosporangium album TaxID=47479 RepID=A0A7W7RXI5_9ACTN|nr:hypothetical protein [Streptosporangium album]MBB4939413.1 hypothetical protein [Streptosporangium album]